MNPRRRCTFDWFCGLHQFWHRCSLTDGHKGSHQARVEYTCEDDGQVGMELPAGSPSGSSPEGSSPPQ